MNEMTKDEILGKLSEMSRSVHSSLREMEHLDESGGSLDGVRETLLASVQENSQSAEKDSINWTLVSIITVALFCFASLMTILIIYQQRRQSQNSEPAIQVNAWKYHLFRRKNVIYINFIIFDGLERPHFIMNSLAREHSGVPSGFQECLMLIIERKNCGKQHCWCCNILTIVSISSVFSVIDIFNNCSLVISSPFDVFVDFHLIVFHFFEAWVMHYHS